MFHFWGRGAAAVRLLLRSPPLHQLSHLFPEFPEFSPIYLQSPPVSMFHCHNASELNLIVNVSQIVWNLFRLNWHKFETSVVLHEINWKFRFCIKYVGSFEIVKAVAFWLSGCCCCWLQKQIMKVDHTAGFLLNGKVKSKGLRATTNKNTPWLRFLDGIIKRQ